MINYNGKLIHDESENFLLMNRGLAFGDGLFETMIYTHKNIQLFNYHWDRLTEGLTCLDLKINFTSKNLLKTIHKTIEVQSVKHESYRVKFMIWRAGKGKYNPQTDETDYLISIAPHKNIGSDQVTICGISTKTTLFPHSFSHLKTISALNYVLAAKERSDRRLEEIILLSHDGHMAEASAANLFIYKHKEEVFITPPLSSGCINGVMRRFLIEELKRLGVTIEEVRIPVSDLGLDTSLILTNVTGIRQVKQLEDTKLHAGSSAFELLKAIIEKIN